MKQYISYMKFFGFIPLYFLLVANVSAGYIGYVVDGSGNIAHDGFGGCVKTGSWEPSMAIPSCGGAPVKMSEVEKKEVDSDGDGVVDSKDKCPNTPTGVAVDAKGCPVDSDNDGVPDYKDRCPNTAPGKRVDVHGCELKSVTSLQGVNFENNSAKLTPSSYSALDDVAATLKKNQDISAEVAGYTDSSGARAYNINLSNRRAQAVRQYLIDKGVAANRLTAKGYGPDNPVASNSTKAGRAKNRRVDLIIKK